MTDLEFAQTKKRLQALADRWITTLGLSWWHIQLCYYDDSAEYHKTLNEAHAHPFDFGHISLATTQVSWEYLQAAIHWNCPVLLEKDDEALESLFVHECCHILVNEMRYVSDCTCENFNVRHEERVVTTLTNAFLWTKAHFQETRAAAPRAVKRKIQPKRRLHRASSNGVYRDGHRPAT